MQALIVAAGQGERFGRPKALVPLLGRPLVAWSVDVFRRAGARRIVLVVRAEDLDLFQGWLGDDVLVTAGGATRAESVRCGARFLLTDEEPVLVHDAARPLLSEDLIHRLVLAGGDVVVPVVEVEDTLRPRAPWQGPAPRRDALWRVQTPQAFRYAVFRHVVATGGEATDEAQLAEALGYTVSTVPGERRNWKVTWPEDLAVTEAVLERERGGSAMWRVGQGYDVHRLVPGRPLILAGVRLPDEGTGGYGLDGHSDADVVLHAVMDACLGAAGLPDIGELFPPGDPRFRDADSRQLLADVLRRVTERGLVPAAVDVTVVAERPRLASFKEAIRQNLAVQLRVPPWAVGVKATTPEGLGALGRGEGMAAFALVTLVGRATAREGE